MKNKICFLLAFAIVVYTASICLAHPKIQDPQDDWKTYQSQWNTFEGTEGVSTLRFTVKYPPDWYVVLDKPDGVVLANFSDKDYLKNLSPGNMFVWVGAHTDTATHGRWVEIKSINGQIVLWITGCLNPLSVDLFVLKSDPNLEEHQNLLFKIGETFRGEKK